MNGECTVVFFLDVHIAVLGKLIEEAVELVLQFERTVIIHNVVIALVTFDVAHSNVSVLNLLVEASHFSKNSICSVYRSLSITENLVGDICKLGVIVYDCLNKAFSVVESNVCHFNSVSVVNREALEGLLELVND